MWNIRNLNFLVYWTLDVGRFGELQHSATLHACRAQKGGEDVCPLICWRHSGVSIRHLQLTPVYSLLVGEPERGVVLI